jgi:hypothetical protein
MRFYGTGFPFRKQKTILAAMRNSLYRMISDYFS